MNSQISEYMICLPQERRYEKLLQRMSNKCSGGGILSPLVVFSSLSFS